MQKVVGSNPISRFDQAPLRRGFFVRLRGSAGAEMIGAGGERGGER